MQFADLSHLPQPWLEALTKWGIRVVEGTHKNKELGGQYHPEVGVVVFYSEWTITTLAHEMVHVMQEVYGRLTDVVFSREVYHSLLKLGYEVDMLEVEAEAFMLQENPEVVLEMLERLPCGT